MRKTDGVFCDWEPGAVQQWCSLVADIHSSSTDPAAWERVVNRLAEWCDANCVQLEVHATRAASAPPKLLAESEAVPRSPDDGSTLRLNVYDTDDFTIALNIEYGRYSDGQHCEAAELLTPHLHQAFANIDALEQAQFRCEAITYASQLSHLPFVLLNDHAEVVYVGLKAERMLTAHGCSLSIQNERLVTKDPDRQQHLNALIQQTLESIDEHPETAGGIHECQLLEGCQLSIHTVPVRLKQNAFLSPQPHFVCVYFHNRSAEVVLDEVLLRSLCGLSEAEIRIAYLVAQGLSLPDIAKAIGISVHTVRTQARSLYAKTRTSGHHELLRLLLTGPACLR